MFQKVVKYTKSPLSVWPRPISTLQPVITAQPSQIYRSHAKFLHKHFIINLLNTTRPQFLAIITHRNMHITVQTVMNMATLVPSRVLHSIQNMK